MNTHNLNEDDLKELLEIIEPQEPERITPIINDRDYESFLYFGGI